MQNRTIFLLITLSSFSAQAQTITYYCKYPLYSDESGSHQAEDDFSLTFLMDNQTGKSYMTGNNGTSAVQVVDDGFDTFTFIEETIMGNVMVTTITPDLKSVHSRNSTLLGELLPSQYYGTCEKR
jgi:hypothetical protein